MKGVEKSIELVSKARHHLSRVYYDRDEGDEATKEALNKLADTQILLEEREHGVGHSEKETVNS